jgi:DNA-binding transcriptional ArsR family regulator
VPDRPPPDRPPEDVLKPTAPAQFRALAHPLRHRLLFALGQQPATISQLATALGAQKGNIAHHLKVLREAGMVWVAETRHVRGGTEQYYRRTAERLVVEPDSGSTAAMLEAVGAEIAAADDPLLLLRSVRLTAEQARQLADALSRLVEDVEDAGPAAARHGLLVSLYRATAPPPRPPVG